MCAGLVFLVFEGVLKEISESFLLKEAHKTGAQSLSFSARDFVDFTSLVDVAAVDLFKL